MKKIWIYLLGVLSGIILMLIVAFIINILGSSGTTFFDKPGDVITIQNLGKTETVKSFEVFQVLDEKSALAVSGGGLFSQELYVLLWNNNGTSYYDNQIVTAPSGKCFRQIGIYRYESQDKMQRTIPIVTLMNGD